MRYTVCLVCRLAVPSSAATLGGMITITLGENGSLVLPEALRNGLSLDRGAKLEVALIGDHIELKPCGKATPASWPPGFFDRIAIDDPGFERAPQGTMPPGVEL
jgi:bifunctional DNA-binding transcriptional regulator/antitoxin component of YhaV-PrlF toxin-antitoxin module